MRRVDLRIVFSVLSAFKGRSLSLAGLPTRTILQADEQDESAPHSAFQLVGRVSCLQQCRDGLKGLHERSEVDFRWRMLVSHDKYRFSLGRGQTQELVAVAD